MGRREIVEKIEKFGTNMFRFNVPKNKDRERCPFVPNTLLLHLNVPFPYGL